MCRVSPLFTTSFGGVWRGSLILVCNDLSDRPSADDFFALTVGPHNLQANKLSRWHLSPSYKLRVSVDCSACHPLALFIPQFEAIPSPLLGSFRPRFIVSSPCFQLSRPCLPLSSACLLPVPSRLRTLRNPSPALRRPLGPGRRNEAKSPEPATGAVSIASSVIATTRARIVRVGVGSAATVVP